jgi:flavin reductase (DIM6/NTAB) family NADH-FMN oxidoreductase RutF
MSSFERVSLPHASRLLNHGPTVLVTTRYGDKTNVMAAAWSMPVEFTPPRIAIVIDKNTYTRELIEASGQFALCLPAQKLAAFTYAVGSASGRQADKAALLVQHGSHWQIGPVLGLPVIEEGCSAWLECRRIPEPHSEAAYDTCFAEVVSAAADPRIFAQGRWDVRDDNADLHTLHHLGAGNFARAGGVVRAA